MGVISEKLHGQSDGCLGVRVREMDIEGSLDKRFAQGLIRLGWGCKTLVESKQ